MTIEKLLPAYRVAAWVTGIGLVILVFVAMPLKYFGHHPGLDNLVGMLHGMIAYPLYVVAGLDLALRARWSPLRTLVILIAGTVPFAAIYLERNVVRDAQQKLALKKKRRKQ